ncbi:hypothetical protein [Streptomyces sp. NPDC051546]|uniref:hypothetical protein n=1 Tax=Streptomyces sp. NPDC051546 TaxID=3365655 RepID=UPI00379469CB
MFEEEPGRARLAGSTAGTVNGPASGGLSTMSPQGDVIIEGTTYEGGTAAVLAVPNPHRALPVRRYTESLLPSGELPPGEAAGIGTWLERD